MFYWVAIDLEQELQELRQAQLTVAEEVGLLGSCALTLPLHVSLKISFPIEEEQKDDVDKALTAYFKRQKPITIVPDAIVKDGSILWIKMEKNEELLRLHDELDQMLGKDFGIPQHSFDKCFLFHATLFMDDGQSKIDAAFERMKGVPLPKSIRANRFILGSSPTGEAGTFSVDKRISVSF